MGEPIAVCHVVNSAGASSIPAEIAARQASTDAFDRIGMLAWFDIDPFEGRERVEAVSLDSPDRFRIDRSQYTTVRSMLAEYDLIHTHHPHSAFYGTLIAKRLGKPVVQTEHNTHDGYTRTGRVANGLTNGLADAVVCVSSAVHESFARWEDMLVRDRAVSVIHNGVDCDRVIEATDIPWSIHDVADIDPGSTVVGAAGMLTEQKAQDVLIEAVDQINAETDHRVELVLSGDGNRRAALEEQVRRARYSDRLHLLGFLDERTQVYKMLSEIDIYAMPSRWEGFCLAVLEAMSLGNPCVLSDIPVFREVYGESALYHAVDDPDALAEQLRTLVADPEVYSEYEQRGTELSKTYSLDRTVTAYTEVYRSVLGNASR
jgi:glycosyltransferase involved in cell wall biosynthesis